MGGIGWWSLLMVLVGAHHRLLVVIVSAHGVVVAVRGCSWLVSEGGGGLFQYFPVPPQFLLDWQESCRNPEDSAKLAELGRTGTEFSSTCEAQIFGHIRQELDLFVPI